MVTLIFERRSSTCDSYYSYRIWFVSARDLAKQVIWWALLEFMFDGGCPSSAIRSLNIPLGRLPDQSRSSLAPLFACLLSTQVHVHSQPPLNFHKTRLAGSPVRIDHHMLSYFVTLLARSSSTLSENMALGALAFWQYLSPASLHSGSITDLSISAVWLLFQVPGVYTIGGVTLA